MEGSFADNNYHHTAYIMSCRWVLFTPSRGVYLDRPPRFFLHHPDTASASFITIVFKDGHNHKHLLLLLLHVAHHCRFRRRERTKFVFFFMSHITVGFGEGKGLSCCSTRKGSPPTSLTVPLHQSLPTPLWHRSMSQPTIIRKRPQDLPIGLYSVRHDGGASSSSQ
jgi:hypothetical protein